jgi:hypothetical protein
MKPMWTVLQTSTNYFQMCIYSHTLTMFKFSSIWCFNEYNLAVKIETRGSVGWACVAHLSFCFEET